MLFERKNWFISPNKRCKNAKNKTHWNQKNWIVHDSSTGFSLGNDWKSLKNIHPFKTGTPWKINMEPENDGLEDDFPFQLGAFVGSTLIFRGVCSFQQTSRSTCHIAPVLLTFQHPAWPRATVPPPHPW